MKALKKNTLVILLGCILFFGGSIISLARKLTSGVNIQLSNFIYQLDTTLIPILVIVICVMIITGKVIKNLKKLNIVLFICTIVLVIHRVYLVYVDIRSLIIAVTTIENLETSYLISKIINVLGSVAGFVVMIISTYLAYKNLRAIK